MVTWPLGGFSLRGLLAEGLSSLRSFCGRLSSLRSFCGRVLWFMAFGDGTGWLHWKYVYEMVRVSDFFSFWRIGIELE